jgi:hypothetical protein
MYFCTAEFSALKIGMYFCTAEFSALEIGR